MVNVPQSAGSTLCCRSFTDTPDVTHVSIVMKCHVCHTMALVAEDRVQLCCPFIPVFIEIFMEGME